jgi:hypothetical protein
MLGPAKPRRLDQLALHDGPQAAGRAEIRPAAALSLFPRSVPITTSWLYEPPPVHEKQCWRDACQVAPAMRRAAYTPSPR